MSDSEFAEYVPAQMFTHERPASVYLTFPASRVPGFGVAVEEFQEFVRRAKAGAYDNIAAAPTAERTLGQVAFEAFVAATGGIVPEWSDQDEAVQVAWIAAAYAAIAEWRGRGGSDGDRE